MWFITNPIVPIGLYTIVNTEILSNVIKFSINSLTNSFSIMATSNSNQLISNYMEEMKMLDIEFKLRIVNNWLDQISTNKQININTSPTFQYIYNSIVVSCENVSQILSIVNQKITNHNNLWFKNWRTIDLNKEIKELTHAIKILGDRISLVGSIMDSFKSDVPSPTPSPEPNDEEFINLI